MGDADYARFAELSFDDFRRLAHDEALSPYERIGFPDAYREGVEARDLRGHPPQAARARRRGQGRARHRPRLQRAAAMLRRRCAASAATACVLVDSAEMLAAPRPTARRLRKVPGRFPDDRRRLRRGARGSVDAILVYSVLHYVFVERDVFAFLDRRPRAAGAGRRAARSATSPTPRCASASSPPTPARASTRSFTGDDPQPPVVASTCSSAATSTTRSCSALVLRARAAGFHAWLVPQDPRPADGQPPRGPAGRRRAVEPPWRKTASWSSSATARSPRSPTSTSPTTRRTRSWRSPSSASTARATSCSGCRSSPFETLEQTLSRPPSTPSTPRSSTPSSTALRARLASRGQGARATALGQLRQQPRLRVAQRRARRALLHLRGQHRAAVRQGRRQRRAVERQPHRPPLDDRRQLLHRLARRDLGQRRGRREHASSASTRRSSTTSRSARTAGSARDVSLTRSIPPGSVYRPPRSEQRDVTSYKLLGVPAPDEVSGSS